MCVCSAPGALTWNQLSLITAYFLVLLPPPISSPPLPPQEGKQLFPRSVVNKETGSKPQTCRCGLMCARWRMDPPTFCRLPSKEQILSSQSRPSPIASPGGRAGGGGA